MNIQEIADAASVIPVLEVEVLEHAAPLANALAVGGLKVVELTLRTDCALQAVAEMKKAEPDLIIGMGTILTAKDVKEAVSAGADFLVSPGADEALLAAIKKSKKPALPGVATASEAMCALSMGFEYLKFFPAEPAGGVKYIKSLHGPLPQVKFCPTGSITADNVPNYLALPNVVCVGGSWIASRSMIANCDWASVTKNAAIATTMKQG